MKIRFKNISIICFILTYLINCKSDKGYTNYKSLNKNGLSASPVVFNVPDKVTDSGVKNLFILLRNDNSYSYANIFLIASVRAGEDLLTQVALEYEMANPDGSWIGKGFTEVKESKLWWKEGVIFPKMQPISIEISQAVRNNGKAKGVSSLKGIESIGICIEDRR